MTDITVNTAISLSKKDLIKYGVDFGLKPVFHVLQEQIKNAWIDLLLYDLKDKRNDYEFILTVKKLEKE